MLISDLYFFSMRNPISDLNYEPYQQRFPTWTIMPYYDLWHFKCCPGKTENKHLELVPFKEYNKEFYYKSYFFQIVPELCFMGEMCD